MIRNAVIFTVCLVVWLLVVWPFELVAGKLDVKWLYLLAGVVAAAMAVAVTREPRAEKLILRKELIIKEENMKFMSAS